MTSYRLTLVLAGAFAVAVIAFATVLAHPAEGPALAAMLLATYGLGLGIGRVTLNRGG